MMAATEYNFTIEQGAAFNLGFRYQDQSGDAIDITGAYIALQCRSAYGDATALITASTTGGEITITDATGGAFTLDFTATETAAFTAGGVYDLELSPGGDTTQTVRLVQGTITLSPEATLV